MSRSVDTLVQLMQAGLCIARLNFSHGDHKVWRIKAFCTSTISMPKELGIVNVFVVSTSSWCFSIGQHFHGSIASSVICLFACLLACFLFIYFIYIKPGHYVQFSN